MTITDRLSALDRLAPLDRLAGRGDGALLDRALRLGARLTTPLLPRDYLKLVDPLLASTPDDVLGVVEDVRPETADSATLVIRVGRGWRPHAAGQWTRLGVDVDGVRHARAYSLTSPEQRGDRRITLTVKAMPGGRVSGHVVRHLTAGTVVHLTQPEGEFVLPAMTPPRILFVTGGSGITPVLSMLRTLTGRVPRRPLPDIVVVHSAPTAADVIAGAELRALAAAHRRIRLHEQHTDTAGMLSPADLAALVPDWAERESWACGPEPMMVALEEHWTAAGAGERLHLERFKPLVAVAGDGAGGTVTYARSGVTATADASTTLLAAGEDAGALLPFGCRMGICHGCVGPLRSGQVRDLRTGEVHGEPGELVQTCISGPAGDCEIDL